MNFRLKSGSIFSESRAGPVGMFGLSSGPDWSDQWRVQLKFSRPIIFNSHSVVNRKCENKKNNSISSDYEIINFTFANDSVVANNKQWIVTKTESISNLNWNKWRANDAVFSKGWCVYRWSEYKLTRYHREHLKIITNIPTYYLCLTLVTNINIGK